MITFCQVTSCGTESYPVKARVDSRHACQMCGAIATRALFPVSIRLGPRNEHPYDALFVKYWPTIERQPRLVA